MHFLMIFAALIMACLVRLSWFPSTGNWKERWQRAIASFLLPPLVILMTAIAVLLMGPQGQMIGLSTDWVSYLLVLNWIIFTMIMVIKLTREALQSWQQVKSYPQIQIGSQPARILEEPLLYSAQVGFWQPELVVSQGLLQSLQPEYLEAVLTHEQAHHYYRDTFWFFWLGWLRRITFWLPHTESLWQELLTLREIRADCWASQKVDPLLLAESLLMVVSSPMILSENFCAAFGSQVSTNRLRQRIDALLGTPESPGQSSLWVWSWLLVSLLPLAVVPLHC